MKRFLLLLFIPLTANAWTRTSDQQIGIRAAQLAPRDLRLVIFRLRNQYSAGIDRALAEEGTDIHRAHLRERIESETKTIISLIRANKPFHVATEEALEPSHRDFDHYFERRMEKFPTVFYGLDSRFTLSQYLERTFRRTANFAPLMSEEYFRGGARHTSAEFDDRSTAFGVASICYSHAITDIVNLDYYIWREAGGDVRSAASMRTPRVIQNAH